jgi:hypothetical protein
MSTLKEDIKVQSDWIVKCFNSDGMTLDYTIKSFIQIDMFFEKHSKSGKPTPTGRLSENLGNIIFSIGGYIGETFIKNAQGAEWITDDNDPKGEISAAIKFPDGMTIWPMQRVMNRLKNGFEDSIYPYGYEFAKNYISEPFDQSFWTINSEKNVEKKPWWKIW